MGWSMNKGIAWIYKITCLSTHKFYIGKCEQSRLKDRFDKHKSELNRNVHFNRYLQKAWNKYGKSNFIFESIDFVEKNSDHNINELEIYWINKLRSNNKDIGYNLTSGGNGGLSPSEETRLKLSLASKKNFLENPKGHFKKGQTAWNKGIPRTEVEKKEHSEKMKGISAWNKGLKNVQVAWNKGIITSDSTKLKQSLAKKGKQSGSKGYSKHSYIIINEKTKEQNTFENAYFLANFLGTTYSSIKNKIRRKNPLILEKYQINEIKNGGL
jgi:group I intron endonuclease